MSRHVWLDRTVEAAREVDLRLPWDRREPPAPAVPAPLRAVG